KLASFNPERIFAWLVPRTTWAFTKSFHVVALLIIGSGLVINYQYLNDVKTSVFELFNLHGLLMAYFVTLSVVTLHEFAHGVTCCHYGGKVQEVGFMLIYFQPAFYCDVSDSWMLASRRERMWVTFAGGYFQLVLWGVCTMIWRITDPDTLINQIVLVVIVYSGIQTLVN